jgi:hypothetical protein
MRECVVDHVPYVYEQCDVERLGDLFQQYITAYHKARNYSPGRRTTHIGYMGAPLALV